MGSDHSHEIKSKVSWSGRFEQGGVWNEMYIDHMVTDRNGQLTGKGSDAIGQFSVMGNLTGANIIYFEKKYDGQHSVFYRGQGDQHNMFRGQWEIPNNCGGNFELKWNIPFWDGHFAQGGQNQPMSFAMNIDGNQVMGQGIDPVGGFAIYGTYNSGNGQCNFQKFYYGQHSVDYHGQHTKSHGKDEIKGNWVIPGNCNGHFEIKKR